MSLRMAAFKKASSSFHDFLVSILETSVTKRDARAYINKFAPLLERKRIGFKQQISKPAAKDSPQGIQEDGQDESTQSTAQQPLYVAIVKFRAPQEADDSTILGVAKSLSALKTLGLISIVVVDCDGVAGTDSERRHAIDTQANRIAEAIDCFDEEGAVVLGTPLTIGDSVGKGTSPYVSEDLFVTDSSSLLQSLQDDIIPVIPSVGETEQSIAYKCVDANDAVLALTRQLSGLQFLGQPMEDKHILQRLKATEVYRLIILDPVGGVPATNRATGRYMFLNLEQEYEEVTQSLTDSSKTSGTMQENQHHLRNAQLARKALSLLPPTSSAIITTPKDAANERPQEEADSGWPYVGTRRKLNPLIHNLLTDKPAQSSSLPSGRFTPVMSSDGAAQLGSSTTLAKRGMHVTILPDPRISMWQPPQPGEPRLRLTDASVDLPRLVHLINDSFGRKLDVEHYLKRVEENLAGIIIAGEYEGGAILTWERPFDADATGDIDPSRLVPYLDKFAVLRKSQGAGGVADIVFNTMVRDCFPYGVCWRSRKDNPVNKWYHERSAGSLKIRDMNWAMFWTTPDLALDEQKFRDYESVCRGVEPSWADKKHVVD
ncbi:Amino-acid acetyltransferase [Apiospora kogelbergensis]|uniref:Amino-acid acetyltransferase, mitochondrial n=1 Tax=Apiospora kogelbergensis TaxID=1337665 RepID=A0AAW0QLM5_9PEZI